MSNSTLAPVLRSAEDFVIQAAWLYYHDGLNQTEIAERLNVSRASVVNYLQQARERGHITITLSEGTFTGHRLAEALCERFSLRSAYVLPDGVDEDSETVFLRVAQGGALWLSRLVESGDRLGVSWGRTVYELARAMKPSQVDDLVVSQLVGSMSTPYGFTAELCSALLAQKFSASCINLHAPAVVSTAELADQLRAEPILKNQLTALSQCNKAVFAAGSCAADSHVVGSGVATRKELKGYIERGATGVICGRFINCKGGEVPGPLQDRLIGVSLPRLKKVQLGLLVSCGPERVQPMVSAIAGGFVTHVVTSASTAEAMLAHA